MTDHLVIVGCSRRKRNTLAPVPALELYEGGCIPQLRDRLGGLRQSLRILSAEHGLIGADEPLLPYDRPLTPSRAAQLRPQAEAALARTFLESGFPHRVLVVAEPLYQGLVNGLLVSLPGTPRLELVDDPRDWTAVSATLDSWGWP
jgi:hypothetical protein